MSEQSTPQNTPPESQTTFPKSETTTSSYDSFDETSESEPKKKSSKGFFFALFLSILLIAGIYALPHLKLPLSDNTETGCGFSCFGNLYNLLKYLPYGMFGLFAVSELFAVFNKRLRSSSFFPLFLTTAVSLATLVSGFFFIKTNGLDLDNSQPYFTLASHFTAALIGLTLLKLYQTKQGKGAILFPYTLLFLISIALMLFAVQFGLKHASKNACSILPFDPPAWLTGGKSYPHDYSPATPLPLGTSEADENTEPEETLKTPTTEEKNKTAETTEAKPEEKAPEPAPNKEPAEEKSPAEINIPPIVIPEANTTAPQTPETIEAPAVTEQPASTDTAPIKTEAQPAEPIETSTPAPQQEVTEATTPKTTEQPAAAKEEAQSAEPTNPAKATEEAAEEPAPAQTKAEKKAARRKAAREAAEKKQTENSQQPTSPQENNDSNDADKSDIQAELEALRKRMEELKAKE